MAAEFGLGTNLRRMIHPASHFSMHNLTRGKTASSVARAAYIGRRRLLDDRLGRTFSYTRKWGLLEEGMTNWPGPIETLWNAAEAAEKRCDARVAREFRAALPAELPLAEQRKVVHGFTCFLKDKYGVASYWAIHAPHFTDAAVAQEAEAGLAEGTLSVEKYLEILADPQMTNRNFHVHILTTTRARVEGAQDFCKKKIRKLDHKVEGPVELKAIRNEWERRVNAGLKRAGSDARIDLRSYADMAAAGEAPPGLEAQPHQGPRVTSIARRKIKEARQAALEKKTGTTAEAPGHWPVGLRESQAGPDTYVNRRQAAKDQNEEIWQSWLDLRASERHLARLTHESERIAEERENARRAEAANEKARISDAPTAKAAREAAARAAHIVGAGGQSDLERIIAWAARGEDMTTPGSADPKIDPETYEHEPNAAPPRKRVIFRREKGPLIRML